MVLDTSALIAILQREPEDGRMLTAIDMALFRRLAAATLVETAIVMHARYGDAGEEEMDLLLEELSVEIVPVSAEHAALARSAFRRFGKGHHPAALNYGDCFSYALSASLREPLLFKGDDFPHTDVLVADY